MSHLELAADLYEAIDDLVETYCQGHDMSPFLAIGVLQSLAAHYSLETIPEEPPEESEKWKED